MYTITMLDKARTRTVAYVLRILVFQKENGGFDCDFKTAVRLLIYLDA